MMTRWLTSKGWRRKARGAIRIAAPLPAAISPLAPDSAQCAPAARSRNALSVEEPRPESEPARNHWQKVAAMASGETVWVPDARASHVASVSCVSSESDRRPPRSATPPRRSPMAPPTIQPMIESREKVKRSSFSQSGFASTARISPDPSGGVQKSADHHRGKDAEEGEAGAHSRPPEPEAKRHDEIRRLLP